MTTAVNTSFVLSPDEVARRERQREYWQLAGKRAAYSEILRVLKKVDSDEAKKIMNEMIKASKAKLREFGLGMEAAAEARKRAAAPSDDKT